MNSVGVLGLSLVDTIISTIQEMPLPGGRFSSVFVDSVITRPGGGAANMAQNLALLDIPVQIFAKTGTDAEGDFLEQTFSRAGVDTTRLTKDSALQTSRSIVCVHAGGERTFLSCTPISATFGINDIDTLALFSHPFLFYQDFFSFPELDGKNSAGLLKEAKEHGIVTFLDECQGFFGVQKNIWEKVLPYVDYLLPSADDMSLIYPGHTPEELCRLFCGIGAKNVIIKHGGKNTVFFDGVSLGQMRPLDEKVIDTTGAGDAFDAGFVWGILKKLPLADAVTAGHIVAAECISHLGAAIPPDNKIELLQKLHAKTGA